MIEEKSCLGCYSYQYDQSYMRNICVHEDMIQEIEVNGHDIPAYFIPKRPEEFCCSLWR